MPPPPTPEVLEERLGNLAARVMDLREEVQGLKKKVEDLSGDNTFMRRLLALIGAAGGVIVFIWGPAREIFKAFQGP